MIERYRDACPADKEWMRVHIPEIGRRVEVSDSKWDSLSARTTFELIPAIKSGLLAHAGRSSVYVSGSMARWEANDDSDLDLMILHNASGSARLSTVQRAHTLALLDRIRHSTGFQEFSKGGDYVQFHSVDDLVSGIGSPKDNSTNQFTARMMLLLDGMPLINPVFHEDAFDLVLGAYWRQVEDRSSGNFLPVYLINDIRRWGLELCLNFEKHNPPASRQNADQQKGISPIQAERRLSNLKLRYARLLGPFSALMLILYESEPDGILFTTCREILTVTPVERLLHLRRVADKALSTQVEQILTSYNAYLTFAKQTKEQLLEQVSGSGWQTIKDEAYAFGDLVNSALLACGDEKPIKRYLIV